MVMAKRFEFVESEMTWIDEIFEVIPPVFWEDFVNLIEGKDVSVAFEVYFECEQSCRDMFDKTLRKLDENLQPLLEMAHEIELRKN